MHKSCTMNQKLRYTSHPAERCTRAGAGHPGGEVLHRSAERVHAAHGRADEDAAARRVQAAVWRLPRQPGVLQRLHATHASAPTQRSLAWQSRTFARRHWPCRGPRNALGPGCCRACPTSAQRAPGPARHTRFGPYFALSCMAMPNVCMPPLTVPTRMPQRAGSRLLSSVSYVSPACSSACMLHARSCHSSSTLTP